MKIVNLYIKEFKSKDFATGEPRLIRAAVLEMDNGKGIALDLSVSARSFVERLGHELASLELEEL